MPTTKTVLLVGGTGRTGRRALHQLLARGVRVRAIVRSAAKLPSDVAHVMCELVTDPVTWTAWKGKLPVVVNAAAGPA